MDDNLSKESIDYAEISIARKYIGIILGPALFFLMMAIPAPAGMTPEGVKVAAVALWMIAWWVSEAVPIAVTALVPLALFPLTGFSSTAEAAKGYSNHLIFLFLGGFIIALTLERWNVHKRIAWKILSLLGTSSRRMLLGFMLATGLVSMWISNTATTMMMLPIAIAVISQIPLLMEGKVSPDEAKSIQKNTGKAIMLGTAYSASLGGIGTLIGTPPNAVLAGALNKMYNIELGFAEWMIVGMPIAILGIFLAWLYLQRRFKLTNTDIPGAKEIIDQKQKELGPISRNETLVLVVFILTAFCWITRKWLIAPIFPKFNDSAIAITSAIIMFILPVQKKDRAEKGFFLLNWESTTRLPWGIVLLFGGGFSLAGAFSSSKLSNWIGGGLEGLANYPTIVIIAAIVLLVTFLTEITSNTASTTLLMPIMGALAIAIGQPQLLIMGAAAIAASCAFMFPVATPPNAIVFSSGYLSIKDMARTGFIMNIGSVIFVTLLGMLLFPMLL